MNDLLCTLLAAPPVLVLALLLYAVIDRETVEKAVEKRMERWNRR